MDDADDLEELEHIVGRINFPPEETLTCAMWVVVVVVMPTFPESQNGEDEAILAGLTGLITTATEEVAEGIDREGGVIEDHGAEAEAPEEVSKSTHCSACHEEAKNEGCDGKSHRWDEVVLVNEDEFRELGEILDAFSVILIVVWGKNPAHVRPVETLLFDRMDVVFLIGMLVMVAVMSGPPECTLLSRHAA